MSYSRWSNSYWYTYWLARSEPDCRNTATFEICGALDEHDLRFQAAEIRKDVDACIERVYEAFVEEDYTVKELRNIDFDELRGYMLNFLADVDKDYPKREYK